MNRVQIAKELVKVAKSLVAADDVFYKMTPLKLKDGGSTRDSIVIAQAIKDAGYEFVSGKFVKISSGGMKLMVRFSRSGLGETKRTFVGFNQGYGGEGPHGLMEFGRIFGLKFDPERVMGNRGAYDDGKEHLLIELEK